MNPVVIEKLDEALTALLAEERLTHGKRFSTHQEANACIKEHFDDALETMQKKAQMLDFLWYSMRHESFGQEYVEAIADAKNAIVSVINSLMMEFTMLSKYEAGVVHEPKRDDDENDNR